MLSLCSKKCGISFPIQYCFLKAWILRIQFFKKKKYVSFFGERKKKKLCKNTRKKNVWKNKCIHDDFFRDEIICTENNCFLNDCIVSVSAGEVPQKGRGFVHRSQATPLARDLSPAHQQDVCSTSYSLSYNSFSNNN